MDEGSYILLPSTLPVFSHYAVCPDADELEWYIPATVLPSHLQRSLNIINQYLETPLDLEGKKPAELMKKKPRRRTRRKREPTPDSDAEDDPESELRRKKREKRRKEKQQYKSAEFIADSDAEMGDMEAFLAKERALRQKTSALAAATGQSGTMRAHGTKKRRRKGKDDKGGKKRRKRAVDEGGEGDGEKASDGEQEKEGEKGRQSESDSDGSEVDVFGSPRRARSEATPDTSPPAGEAEEPEPPKAKPRPRPRPRARVSKASSPVLVDAPSPAASRATASPKPRAQSPLVLSDDEGPPAATLKAGGRKTARLVISDEEDD